MDARITIRSPYEAALATRASSPPSVRVGDGPVDAYTASAPEPRPAHRLRRFALGALAAVAVAGSATAGGIEALAHAPICASSSQSVAIEGRHLCVSTGFGAQVAGADRYMKGLLYDARLPGDLTSSQSRVYHPDDGQAPPRPLMEDGRLRVVSWNIHKSQSPDRQGARPEDASVVQRMLDARADVYILQEVGPWQVQSLVDATGMNGYFSMTIPDQGDLVLVNPALKVTDQTKAIVNEKLEGAGGAAHGIKEWYDQSGEPRQAQAVRVETPGGRGVVIWNSHLMTTADLSTPEGQAARTDEARHIAALLDGFAGPGDAVVGGGDFNAMDHTPTVNVLRQDGFDAQGEHIDWITARGAGDFQLRHATLLEGDGVTQTSDHPMVWADIPV
jgi:endonuclease/exonuclease/phosphatase family metal-dependent hydrolase